MTSTITAETVRIAGETITHAQVEAIARKFRQQIGGCYDYVAAAIEHDHEDVTE